MNIVFHTALLISILNIQQSHERTFQLEEAKIQFTIEGDWELASKTGSLEQGKIQYSYTHPHIEGAKRTINPSIIITLDKASSFESEKHYVTEKWDFHRLMDDQLGEEVLPKSKENPIQSIDAYYVEGESGLENNPYGQKLVLVTFWNKTIGFHMEIQTSISDSQLNSSRYKPIFKIM